MGKGREKRKRREKKRALHARSLVATMYTRDGEVLRSIDGGEWENISGPQPFVFYDEWEGTAPVEARGSLYVTGIHAEDCDMDADCTCGGQSI